MVCTLALLWFPLHLWQTLDDWGKLRGCIGSLAQRDVEEAQEARVEEEFWKLRQTNYRFFCCCLCHINFPVTLLFTYKTLEAPGLDNIVLLVLCIGTHVHYSVAGKDSVRLTPRQLKAATYSLHVACAVGILAAAGSAGRESAHRFALLQCFVITFRFCLVLAFLDPWVTIPFQVVYTTLELLIRFFVFSDPSVEVMSVLCGQFFLLVIVTASSILMNVALRERIYALLDTADAESLVCSFRRMLRGINL